MKTSPQSQQGFILVAAIWVMAILVLMVGAFALWVENSLNTAVSQNQKTQMALHNASTKAILLYITATQSATPGGITTPAPTSTGGGEVSISLEEFFANVPVDDLGAKQVTVSGNELKVDSTVYSGVADTRFSIQDLSGLIPLNSRSPVHSESLLAHLDVEPALRSRLSTILLDYLDIDDGLRPNGAEAFQYTQGGLAPPANAGLLSRQELVRVLDWQGVEPLWKNDDLLSVTAALQSTHYNVNAVPALVAQIAFGLSEQDAQLLIEERKEKSYLNINEIVQRTGLNLYPYFDTIRLTPSRDLRLSFWYPDARLKREIDVHFLSVTNAGDSPWIISRDIVVPISESEAIVEPRQPQTDLFR
ncbi:hypothetical protein DRW07_02530 [Alteromonas sediminis]|uniref:General secretion pathway protein GspK n=1 Tax=Alteromonas sediminis TaxID=2259342 RepID=A0A3N5Y366_9ALTE|nr:type II secretion system protein GspK [Alteromonas sediminis]RPJ68302.1 hypothetical protein DRW07_02530 [Alteromonas sediminis]